MKANRAVLGSAATKEQPERRPVKLPVWGRGGVLPGVDLDDSASLLDLMERKDSTL